jgi:hypothetical protein
MSKVKYDYTYVNDYFLEQGCELLENNYKNNKQKLKYRCVCGNIAYITFECFKNRGQRCSQCSGRNVPLTYDYVYQYFLQYNCQLLEKDYIDNQTKMKYRCRCGNISFTSFNNFKRGAKCCMNCKDDWLSLVRAKYTIDDIANYFSNNNCELLEIEGRINTKSQIKFKCECGNIGYTIFGVYKNSKYKRCSKCVGKFNRGENHYLFNPNKTDEERLDERHYAEYYQWRLEVYKRDNFTCQICGQEHGNINAHHLNSYTDYPEQRLDIDNGATLCETCHILFHKIYTYYHNTKDQFLLFKNNQILNKQYTG